MTIHDLTLHKYPGGKRKDWLSRFIYKILIRIGTRRAKHLFAVSENTKKDLQDILKIPASKITTAYNGLSDQWFPLSPSEIKKYRQKKGLPDQFLLYNGVARPHKNLDFLLRAFARFRETPSGKNWHLVMSGPATSSEKQQLQSLAKELKTTKYYHHLGLWPEDEMNQLMNTANAYVFPSLYEGFGLPPLEAMKSGVPTTVSQVSSLPEVCGSASVYFDPTDQSSLEKALEQVTNNQELREQLKKQGAIQAKKFTWSNMAQIMWDRYQKVW